jgi:outer membrane protein assembly factor BamB
MYVRPLWLLIALLVAATPAMAESPPAAPGQRLPIDPTQADKIGYLASWYQNLELPGSQRVVAADRLGDLLVVREEPSPIVTAISLSDGRIKWQRQFGKRGDLLFKPLRSGDRLFFTTELRLTEVDARNGAIKQRANFDVVNATDPVLFENTLVFATEGGVMVGYHVNRKIRQWKHAMPRRLAAPMVQKGSLFLATDVAGHYALFDASNGTRVWRGRTFDAIRSEPAIDSDTVYLASTDQSVYAVDLRSAQDRWVYRGETAIKKPVRRIGRHLFVLPEEKGLLALDHKSGDLRWQVKQPLTPVAEQQGQLLLFGKDQLTLIRSDSGVVISDAPCDPMQSVIAGPEGSVVLVTPDGRLQRLNFSR